MTHRGWAWVGARVFDFFFPRTCGVCGEDVGSGESVLCAACVAAFPRWTGLACRVCGVPLSDGGARCFECRRRRRQFRFCRSLGLYDGLLRKAILALKYRGRDALAEPLGKALARAFTDRPEFRGTDALVPVPLHFLKRHGRGFNQSELLARSMGGALGLPVWDRALVRRRWTKAQASLNRESRRANVKDAFEVPVPERVAEKRIVLIDDVCTTGATLEAAAQALRAAGARSVSALTLARDC